MKYLITCSTCFCGCDEQYGIESENVVLVDEIAEQLAYDNFYYTHNCQYDAIADDGYNLDTLSDDEFEDLCTRMDEDGGYWWATVEEFEGSEEEWNNLEKVYE
jgi:hypothetical protein